MVRPSPALSARLRLTTKQVNGGYYKGNKTGSMGAHTEWGGYVIDYRKVRNYNCPDLKELRDSKLTPFVSARIAPRKMELRRANGTTFIPAEMDGKAFISAWEHDQPDEYNKLKEEWRAYLEAIGTIRAKEEQTQIEESAPIQKMEDAMAEPGDGSSKPNSWMERDLGR